MTLNLDDLERVAKAATPGEWEFECGGHSHRYAQVTAESERTIHYKYGSGASAQADRDEADAAHIAAFDPPTVLALISRARGAERLEKERKEATDELVKHMVNRFLWWRLPEDFHPYCGIHFDAYAAINMNPRNTRYEPVGTNLFTATQAEEMVRHMLEGAE